MKKTKRLALLSLLLLASVGFAFVAQGAGALEIFADNSEEAEIRLQTAVVSLILTPEEQETATNIALMDPQIQVLLNNANNYTISVSEVFDIRDISFNMHETVDGIELVPQQGIAKVTIEINNDYGDEFGSQTIEVTVDLVMEKITKKDVQPEVVKPKEESGIISLSELVDNPSNYDNVIVTVSGKVSLLGEVFGSLFELEETVTVFYSHQDATVDVSDIENGDIVTVTGKFSAPNTLYATAIEKNYEGT